ncbi:MAG: YgjP-like metallopeptidase domain-containing protein, partial [Gammaproteobacteria bacterium]|nr:YgjP-like metallopeptidase domain-containing protein [Gammaproteobacteria bacterium]
MEAQLDLWSRPDTRWAGNPDLLFAIRPSNRAKHLILQVLPPRTIEVVVPRGMHARAVESFVDEHQGWIERAGWELLQSYPEAEIKPSAVELRALGRTMDVRYESSGDRGPYYREHDGTLELYCRDGGADDGIILLQRWLRAVGRRELTP